jgi:hypothetical protein
MRPPPRRRAAPTPWDLMDPRTRYLPSVGVEARCRALNADGRLLSTLEMLRGPADGQALGSRCVVTKRFHVRAALYVFFPIIDASRDLANCIASWMRGPMSKWYVHSALP